MITGPIEQSITSFVARRGTITWWQIVISRASKNSPFGKSLIFRFPFVVEPPSWAIMIVIKAPSLRIIIIDNSSIFINFPALTQRRIGAVDRGIVIARTAWLRIDPANISRGRSAPVIGRVVHPRNTGSTNAQIKPMYVHIITLSDCQSSVLLIDEMQENEGLAISTGLRHINSLDWTELLKCSAEI
jgi:hypothetical protein